MGLSDEGLAVLEGLEFDVLGVDHRGPVIKPVLWSVRFDVPGRVPTRRDWFRVHDG